MLENKKNIIFNKTNKILLIVLLVLTIVYIISFTKSCSSTDKREIIKTALVNKKYEDKIETFEIQSNGKLITLSNLNNSWYVIPSDNPEISLPADNNRVAGFITDLITVSEMYKLSDKIEKNNAFGFDSPTSFNIRYYLKDDRGFNDIIFGNQDFALSSRYIMSGKSTTVYEISNKLDKYLSTEVQLWAEPYIISQQFLGPINSNDIQRAVVKFTENGLTSTNIIGGKDFNSKLLELRHGGFPTSYYFSFEMFNTPLLEIKLELGNRNNILIKIVQSAKSDEQEYFVEVTYENNKDNLNYTSYSKISGWTYNKIKEIML